MGAWPTPAAAIVALRNILYDGPQDKLAAQKKVFGTVDGVNTIFKTFEYRRLTDFTLAQFPLGVFLNGAQIDSSEIDQDDTGSGTFIIDISAFPAGLPQSRTSITASYYYQWFVDAELDQFLQDASNWLGQGSTYINLPGGLGPVALRFAAQEAYEALASKYSVRIAQTYQLEDAPSEDILKSIQAFKEMSEGFLAKAETMRNDFYTRQGQSLAPNFNFQLGRVWDPTPRR